MTTTTTPPTAVPAGSVRDGQQPAAQQPLYPNVDAWVNGYFAPMFLHRIPGNPRLRWCARWWDHAEAIVRLTVLWNTWEAARWEPAAKPGWWLDLDHHLPILLGLDGPFRNCRQPEGQRASKHEPQSVPGIEPAPQGWWD